MEAGATGNSVADAAGRHPIGLIVTDDLRRSRLTVFFRLLLVIPQAVWLSIWSIAVALTVLIAWFAALVTGRVPDGLHNFNASFLRYATRVTGYLFLLAEPWPWFTNAEPYPLDARVDPTAQQSRLTVFFRLILAIPALILVYVFRAVNEVVAFLAWFYCLVVGQMHEGMRNVSAWLLRYEVQTYAYLLLLTGRYPSLAGAPTA
jgi:Domain of unknown function (DUF4389)